MSTYVILGGNGVFGVHTAIYLLQRPDVKKVICVGRNSQKSPAYSLDVGKGDSRYAYHQIHLTFEEDRLFELFDSEKPEVIINFAALAHGASWDKSWRFYETNVTALAKMVEGLLSRDYLQRWIQIGSSELYGAVDGPAAEDAPLRPSSPYGISKMAGDLHLETMFAVRKFPMNIIRPSNSYGPGQQLYRIIPQTILCARLGKKLSLHGGGLSERSFIHMNDVSDATYRIAMSAELGQTYHISTKRMVSIVDLVRKICEMIDVNYTDLVKETEERLGKDQSYMLNSEKLRMELEWKDRIDLEEGIATTIEWVDKNLDILKNLPDKYIHQS